MSKQAENYHAYLLRLWRDHEDAPWRATLHNPHTGEELGFADVQALVRFLLTQTENVSPPESL